MDVEVVVAVTAKPDTERTNEDGLYDKVAFDEVAAPEAVPVAGVNSSG